MKIYNFKKILAIFVLSAVFFIQAGFFLEVNARDPSGICGPCCNTNSDCLNPATVQCVGAGALCKFDDLTGTLGQCLSNDPQVTTFCPFSSHTDIKELVASITKWIFILALVIAPLMILLGGFYMLTAAGEPSRSTQGKKIITWAMIGLAVIIFAKAFISIIKFVLK